MVVSFMIVSCMFNLLQDSVILATASVSSVFDCGYGVVDSWGFVILHQRSLMSFALV